MIINTMNRNISFIIFVFAGVLTQQGCAAKSLDLADKGKVHIETAESMHGHVSRVSVLASDMGTRVTGEVHGAFHQRGYIRGHLVVEVISPDGVMRWKEAFRYRNRGGKSRITPFSLEVPIVVHDGSTIRVTHNAGYLEK